MSRLYNLIEEQILNLVSALTVVDQQDQVVFLGFNISVQRPIVQSIIKFLSALFYLGIALFFGVHLWNQGLAAVMPTIIAPIGRVGAVPQLKTDYMQLIVTLFALMLIL